MSQKTSGFLWIYFLISCAISINLFLMDSIFCLAAPLRLPDILNKIRGEGGNGEHNRKVSTKTEQKKKTSLKIRLIKEKDMIRII